MVMYDSLEVAMETIAISKFKAKCLSVLQRVKRTGKPGLVTRFGQAHRRGSASVRASSSLDLDRLLSVTGAYRRHRVARGGGEGLGGSELVRLLLDTHIWVWSLLDPAKLSRRVRAELESPDNELWLSPISVWELLVLIDKGRVEVDKDSVQWVAEVSRTAALREAALTHEVAV
jgi:hypothetical protein